MMNRYLAYLFALLVQLVALPGQAQLGPAWAWAQQAGVPGADVALDAAGNLYVVGVFGGTTAFGSSTLVSRGSLDVSLAKYDAEGRLLWVQQAGGADADFGAAVAVDAGGNVYLTGGFTSASMQLGGLTLAKRGYVGSHPNLFVAKYSSQGTALWARALSGPTADDAGGGSLAVDAQGNVYAAGGFYSYLDLPNRPQLLAPAGGRSCFLLKFDPQGTMQWARSAGDTGVLLANQSVVSTAPNGQVYFAGSTLTGPAYVNNAPTTAPLQTFVRCYDATGAELWGRVASSSEGARPTDLAADAQGNAVLAGNYRGEMGKGFGLLGRSGEGRAYAISYDPRGNLNWAADAGNMSFSGVATDAAGNVYVAGARSQDVAFGPFSSASLPGTAVVELCVAKLTRLGQVAWVRLGGGSSSSAATAVATDAQGNAYVTGWGQGSGHCGAAAAGPPGFVLAKLRTGPEVLPATESAPLSAYPNPVSEPSFDLFLQGTAEGWGELQLISAQGQLVRTQAVYLSPGVVQAPFDRRGLAPGRYTLRLTQGARVSTTQLLLQ